MQGLVRGLFRPSITLAGVALALALSTACRAATIDLVTTGKANVIGISGRMVAGDAVTFEAVAKRADPRRDTLVELSGPGGLIFEGMKIGVSIHERKWSTLVGDGHLCASTCAMIWLAGQPRVLSSDGHVGFHAPYDKKSFEVDAVAVHVVKTYAGLIGLGDKAVAFIIAKSPGTGLSWIDARTAEDNGFAMEIAKSTHHTKGEFSPATLDLADTVATRARTGGEDALVADLQGCYATFGKERSDAAGFRCFAMEAFSDTFARQQAKAKTRAIDPRLTSQAGIHRLSHALDAAGYRPRRAIASIKRWQANLTATAAAR